MKYFVTIVILTISMLTFAQKEDSTIVHRSLSREALLKPSYYKMDMETLEETLNRTPSFGMFHENYFITGIPTNEPGNSGNADAKFQVSISQRLFKRVLPLRTILLLTYSQKSFWKIYANSSPFTDNNYNPGITITHPIIYDNKMRGIGVLSMEHESNGLDSIYSRSWNYVTVSGVYFFNTRLSGQIKFWTGAVDKKNNADLLKYKGHGLFAINFKNFKDNLRVSTVITPRHGGANSILEFSLRLNPKANQFFFIQWYNGYAEDLIDYMQYSSMIRAGICMKSSILNFY